MKNVIFITICLLLGSLVICGCAACNKTKCRQAKNRKATCEQSAAETFVKSHPNTDFYPGWRLGTQAYTFKEFTFFEAVDKAASLGLHWIEGYSNQIVGGKYDKVKTHYTMSEEVKQAIKDKLDDAGVTLIAYGVITPGGGEKEWRKLFEFCSEMGIDTITSEPKAEQIDTIEQLCKEYHIKLAIHNHPKPSRYWNPEKVLEACKGRSKWIGACADTGHWMRSGIKAVEGLRMLKGRINSLHLKDLNKFGTKEAHDVVWGTGKADFEQMLKELHDQGFKGMISIEYEYNWENSVPDLRKCILAYKKAVAKLAPGGCAW